jgi:two-component system sensor histidine kinase HydH
MVYFSRNLKEFFKGIKEAPAERFPIWAANLLFFFLLFCMVLSFFFYQMAAARNAFLKDVNAHGRLVAEVVSLNARGAVLAGDVVEEVFGRFLSNTARFIDYLDTVQPFTAEELTAFARESGLAGIRIVRSSGASVEGPGHWTEGLNASCGRTPSLNYMADRHLTVLTITGMHAGCIVLAVGTSQIDAMLSEVGLKKTLSKLYQIEGIRYVRLEGALLDDSVFRGSHEDLMNEPSDLGHVVEERVPLETGGLLVVGIDATLFHEMTHRLVRDFTIFSLLLALVGSLLSWLLYGMQKRYLQAARTFEQSLSAQREDAALGRATAAIAHEIRNPLNAIAMAMQRLIMEVQGLSGEHRKLLDVSLSAVGRANRIISSLLHYARPIQMQKTEMDLKGFIEDSLQPYRGRLEELGITLQLEMEDGLRVGADVNLLGQVMDNLIKNAMDAQPEGGFLRISVHRADGEARLCIQNAGCALSEDEVQSVFEPYYTTRIQGTGLGLAIVKRIIFVHGGRVEAFAKEGVFELVCYLPLL